MVLWCSLAELGSLNPRYLLQQKLTLHETARLCKGGPRMHCRAES
uniref:Uncharacterized protein n=1 Tax=Anguilla anguilla TaxID=7936 RepID=A0A0E9TQP0_ANGAN